MLLLTWYLVNERLDSLLPSLWAGLASSYYQCLISCFHSNFYWSASSTAQLWPSRTSSWQSKTTSNCVWLNAGPHPRSEVMLGRQEGGGSGEH